MFQFIDLKSITDFITLHTSLDLSGLTAFENSLLYLFGNMFYIIGLILILSIAFKIIIRFVKMIF